MKEREIIKNSMAEFVPHMEKIRFNATNNVKRPISIKKLMLTAACIMLFAVVMIGAPFINKGNGKTPLKGVVTTGEQTEESGETDINEYLETNETEGDPIQDETWIPNPDDPPAIGGGGSGYCSIHKKSHYHYFYNDVLIDYIGTDEYNKWMDSFYDETKHSYIQDENGCLGDMNIVNFIKRYNIPNEVVLEAYFHEYYKTEWNIEILLTRDEKAYSEYCLSDKKIRTDKTKALLKYEENVKDWIVRRISQKTDEKSKAYYEEIKYASMDSFSIMELVENSSLTVEDLESCVYIDKNKHDLEYNNYYCRPYKYIYNFDLLFDERASLDAEIAELEFDPLVPKSVQLDALLHVGENGKLAKKGDAVETEYGIYIPEGLLPENDQELLITNDFIQYNGRIFWYTETVTSNEETIREDIIYPLSQAYSWDDYHPDQVYKEPFNWKNHLIYDYTSTLDCDVYLFKNYDDSFRIMLCDYYKDPNTFMIFESNRGVTLDKGSDLFGESALDFENNARFIYNATNRFQKMRYNKNASENMDEVIKALLSADFCIDKSDLSGLKKSYISFTMLDTSNVNLTVYENGYVEYQNISGYNVYLKLTNQKVIDLLMGK